MQSFLLISVLLACALSLPVVSSFRPAAVPFLWQQTTSLTQLSMARGPNRPRNAVREKKPVMNSEIEAGELRVVTPSPQGKDVPLGIMSREDALAKAQEMGGMDLILVNAKSDPPVCKIVDYSKYRYEQEKKAKEIKKNSKATEIKEVKMSYKIDVHDYDVRKKNASKFLRQGNRVKCTVMFRGREVTHDKLGFELLEKLSTDLEDMCTKEGKPKREGRNLSLILSPRVELLKKVNEERRNAEKAKKKKKQATKQERLAAKAAGAVEDTEDSTEDVDADDDSEDDDLPGSLDEMLSGDKFTEDLFS